MQRLQAAQRGVDVGPTSGIGVVHRGDAQQRGHVVELEQPEVGEGQEGGTAGVGGAGLLEAVDGPIERVGEREAA